MMLDERQQSAKRAPDERGCCALCCAPDGEGWSYSSLVLIRVGALNVLLNGFSVIR